jgi:SAM-dependent methyltransferase
MFRLLILKIYLRLPTPVRRIFSGLKKRYIRLKLRMQLRPIRIDACLLGGDNGVSAASFARMVGDIRRASRPIFEWPHVKLLRQYDSIGEQLWNRRVFEETEYYRNAVINIEMCGRYFDAVTSDQIHLGARRFVNWYRGVSQNLPPQAGQSDEWNENEYINVHPVKDSTCYQVLDGHHRLAIAYMKGVREVPGFIRPPSVMTPVQQLLLDVSWLKGRRELYQPVDSPEVRGWVLVRRCSDRLAKMKEFLCAEGLMPPAITSYLDVACSYGWFVAEMSKAGFQAEGVERDPLALEVGRVMYSLMPEQTHRADAVTFLRVLQKPYDITSCFSLTHHYILNRLNVSAEQLLHLLDSATRRVMFFDMGQNHEEFFSGGSYVDWNPDYIGKWLKDNTTFSRIVPLGKDEDAVPPFQHSYGRMLFACVR